MAERKNLANKLQLVISYIDENDAAKVRKVSYKGLKGASEPAAIISAAEALAGLQEDSLTKVVEIAENEILAA
ncbi:DUF1659 domain-containing protein [uncultured Megasphaera sp.]|uniref:DUF1659 domain-containing protein n=1 Tax=uncultured Megasphaera sp. TaxID=165188 RepID=UPI0025986A65|nr:DUF1659 domain-containing protein [uncultured Megasphaera sp.]